MTGRPYSPETRAADVQRAIEVLLRQAAAAQINFDAALHSRLAVAVRVRHAAYRELFTAHWSLNRIGRAFGVSHSVVLKALRKVRACPACGEKYEKTTDAPVVWTAGVATSRAYHHAGAMCFVQTAWVNRGEESPAGAA
jgi:hypothetical protein